MEKAIILKIYLLVYGQKLIFNLGIPLNNKLSAFTAEGGTLLADLGKAGGCSTNTFVTHWLSPWVILLLANG